MIKEECKNKPHPETNSKRARGFLAYLKKNKELYGEDDYDAIPDEIILQEYLNDPRLGRSFGRWLSNYRRKLHEKKVRI